jgi:large subunit ribosomal protein L25
MARITVKAELREGSGKEAAKKLREKGFIPAVVYSSDTNITVSIPQMSLKALRSIHFSESAIIDMEIGDGKKSKTMPVLIKDIQFHPLSESIWHIDFLKVSLKEKIKVHIPIMLKGEAKGVKEGEGVLEQILRELEVEGLPLDIPEKIEVDISEFEIGDSLHAEELSLPPNLKLITNPKATIATVVAKQEEEEVEAPVAEEEAPTEPEVIKEKKEAAEPEQKEEKKKEEKKKEEK